MQRRKSPGQSKKLQLSNIPGDMDSEYFRIGYKQSFPLLYDLAGSHFHRLLHNTAARMQIIYAAYVISI